VAGTVDEGRFDTVHQPSSDAFNRSPEQDDDRGRDNDADDGVGQREAEHDTHGAEDDGKGGEPVQAGVNTVGDEGGGADLLSDADAIDGDDFVACEADQSGEGDEP